MHYEIVIEKASHNYSADAPDLPGCVATGDTIAEVEREMREAIRFHLDGMREDGLEPPTPSSMVDDMHARRAPIRFEDGPVREPDVKR